jgi:flagellar P-ring protein precursor FlgI
MGDAKSLKGGSLLATPLLGADGEVYAIAQGTIIIGQPATGDQTKNKPTPTSGYITNGAIVEQSIGFDMNNMDQLRLALKNPDISTARVIASAINSQMRDEIAQARDPGTVNVRVPVSYRDNVVDFLAEIESLSVEPDAVAKVIIDESTGTIVIGENVKISKVAIAQGNLTLKVSDSEKLSFFLDENNNEDNNDKIAALETNATLSDLVQGLNMLGVKPQDLISILKSIERSGALQATIEVR